jgi:hypothetical protein
MTREKDVPLFCIGCWQQASQPASQLAACNSDVPSLREEGRHHNANATTVLLVTSTVLSGIVMTLLNCFHLLLVEPLLSCNVARPKSIKV